jgi:hypothetical protein
MRRVSYLSGLGPRQFPTFLEPSVTSPTKPRSVSEVRKGLLQQLEADELKLNSISTRVLLRTGISIVHPEAAYDNDPEAVEKTLTVLADLGHDLR